jgi:hypothetical protein
MRSLVNSLLVLSCIVAGGLLPALGQNRLPPDAPRPIDAVDSLWAEELTFMEVRDAIRNGTTTIIIGTGVLREYYFEDQWSYDYLKTLGITQIDKTPPPGEAQDRPTAWRNGIHDDIYYEAQVAVQDAKLIRMEQRLEAGRFSLHGVELAPIEKTIDIGRKLAAYRAEITAGAFEASRKKLREGSSERR